MSVLAQVTESQSTRLMILSKGAPEVLSKFMISKPADYDQTYLKHVKEGSRVLALAYKNLPKISSV